MSDFRDRIKINQLKKIAPNIGNKIEKDYN